MRIECLHGYFRFTDMAAGQLARFSGRFGLEIVRSGDHLTFDQLAEAPNYSIVGSTFLGAPTTKTFEGPPWEVMRENGLVLDLSLGRVVPALTIFKMLELSDAGLYFVSAGMIQPGSLLKNGSRVTDYTAFYSQDRGAFKISEISYE